LKQIFFSDKVKEERGTKEKDYERYLKQEDEKDSLSSLAWYLNDVGYTDEEIINEVLEREAEEYFVAEHFDRDSSEGYWSIYIVENPYRKAYDILMDYWDSLPDGEKEDIDEQLKELDL